MFTIVVAGAVLSGILLWTAFDRCLLRLRKQRSPGMRKAVRILAVTRMVYIMLLLGALAFFMGHQRGASGQSLLSAFADTFIPYRTPEILLLPAAIFCFLMLLGLAVRLVLVLTARESSNNPDADTAKPPAD